MRHIPFNDTALKAQKTQTLLLKMFKDVIASGMVLYGKENEKLLQSMQTVFKTNHIVLCGSGHDAIALALQSLHLCQDDEIIFPVNAYPTAFPIYLSCAKPVPVDVDKNGQLDPAAVKKAITKHTKAIIMVHLYGLVGQLDTVQKLAQKNKITLIEDCAQSFGTLFKDKPTGTIGDYGCFSFYPTKNLGTLGDGGMILTKSAKQYSYLQSATRYGEKNRYECVFISGHSRIPELQAAVLNVYVKDIKREKKEKQTIAKYYEHLLTTPQLSKYISVFQSHPKSNVMQHLFVIKAKRRDELKLYLAKHGIETLIHYPKPIHHLKAFGIMSKYPQADEQSKAILSLPFHSHLQQKDVEYIVKKIHDFYYV